MAKPAFLEAFEVIDGGRVREPSQDWRDGHAAGLAEGVAAAGAGQQMLSEELVQVLADMAFGYHEARSHMMQALEPLFESLAAAFVPRFAQEMLVPAIAQALAQVASEMLDAPIILSVASAQHDAVRDALARITDLPFELRGDAALGSGQAIITGGATERILDVDVVIAHAQAILAALLDTNQQRSDHG